jgi:hypothetical protein
VRIILPSQPHRHKTRLNVHHLSNNLHRQSTTSSTTYTTRTMMLTSSLFMPPQQQYYSPYTPPRSSPLSERHSNVAPRSFDFGMASPPSNNMKSPTPQRAFKPNPVIQTRDAATKRRRDMFFKRVQNGREDKKWESRGEQVSANLTQLLWLETNRNRFNNSTLRQKESDGKPRRHVKHLPRKMRWLRKTRLYPNGR